MLSKTLSQRMELFGRTHIALLIATALCMASAALLVRTHPTAAGAARKALGWSLIANELVWWTFRYSHEGLHLTNLPLQLCDVTLWGTAIACLTLKRPIVEFAYFAGLAGAGIAILTPDLWSPWPTYPAIYFFIAHGGIVVGAAMLVWGRISPLEPGALWRAFGFLVAFAAIAGAFNAIFGTNYMYLSRKPASTSPLDAMGPWPVYLAAGAAVGLAVFAVLWWTARLTQSLRSSPLPRPSR